MEYHIPPAVSGDAAGNTWFRILKNATPTASAERKKCSFILIPASPPGDCYSRIDDVIYKNGGEILEDSPSTENAVTILDEMFYFDHPDLDDELPLDTFSSAYLYDVDQARRMSSPPPDLNKYRLTATRYTECDSNKILFYEMKWSDLPEIEKQSTTKVTAQQAVARWKKAFGVPAARSSQVPSNNASNEAMPIGLNVKHERTAQARSPSTPVKIGPGTTTTAEPKKVLVQPKDGRGANPVSGPAEAGNRDDVSDEDMTDDSSSETESTSAPVKKTPDLGFKGDAGPGNLPVVRPTDVRVANPESNREAGNRDDGSDENADTTDDSSSETGSSSAPVKKRPNLGFNGTAGPSKSPVVRPKGVRSANPVSGRGAGNQDDGSDEDTDMTDDSSSETGSSSAPVKKRQNLGLKGVAGPSKSPVVRPKGVRGENPESGRGAGNRDGGSDDDTTDDSSSETGCSSASVKKRPNLDFKGVTAPNDLPVRPKEVRDANPASGRKAGNVDDGSDKERINDRTATRPTSTPVKIVPKPSTTAVIKNPNLVWRGAAGPNKLPVRLVPVKDARGANPVSGPSAGIRDGGCSSDDNLSFHDNSSDARSTDTVSSSKSKTFNLFTLQEGQLILDLICEHKAFLFTKGNKLWQLMEKSGKFPKRTFQSLKEHFRRKVLPNALKNMRYSITPDNLKRLKKAQDKFLWKKHSNVCPDYVF